MLECQLGSVQTSCYIFKICYRVRKESNKQYCDIRINQKVFTIYIARCGEKDEVDTGSIPLTSFVVLDVHPQPHGYRYNGCGTK